jgi:hypothetical protein
MTKRNRSRFVFYGGLIAFLLVLYGGALTLALTQGPNGREFEAATDLAVPVLIGAFVGRKFGMGWGIFAAIVIAGVTQVGNLPKK